MFLQKLHFLLVFLGMVTKKPTFLSSLSIFALRLSSLISILKQINFISNKKVNCDFFHGHRFQLEAHLFLGENGDFLDFITITNEKLIGSMFLSAWN